MIKGYASTKLVYVDEEILSIVPSLKVFNHSPTGFGWGYNGSGPAQLALAILLLLCPQDQAIMLYQRFKKDFIAPLKIDNDFELSEKTIKTWISKNVRSA